MITTKYKESVTYLFECFRAAEDEIKKFEKQYGDVPIPSINQLRYAGYHIAEAAQNNSSEVSVNTNIEKAVNHCKRAKYDAHEASSTLVLDRIRLFNERYKKVTETQKIISDYSNILGEVNEVSEKLQETIPSSFSSRDEYYNAVEEGNKRLKAILKKLEESEPAIEALVEENNYLKKKDSRRFAIQIILAIIGAIFSFALLSTKLGFFSDNNEKKDLTQSNIQNIKNLPSTPSPKPSEN
jgi:DNA repair exonuclease SbcCD ATPase subunit